MKVALKTARYPVSCSQCGGKVKHGEKYIRYEYGHDPVLMVKIARFCPRCCLAGPDIRNGKAKARAAALITKANRNGGWADLRFLNEVCEVEKALLSMPCYTKAEAVEKQGQIESYYARRREEAKALKAKGRGKDNG